MLLHWASWGLVAFHILCRIILLICDNSVTYSKFVIFQDKGLKVLKCIKFLWVQRRHNCSPAASLANCVMTLHLLKGNLQTFISIQINQKCQILICDIVVRYTGCNRRNGPDFGRVFLMLYYTDITQNTCIQTWTVWEIMAIENCGLPCGPRTIAVSWDFYLLVGLLAELFC